MASEQFPIRVMMNIPAFNDDRGEKSTAYFGFARAKNALRCYTGYPRSIGSHLNCTNWLAVECIFGFLAFMVVGNLAISFAASRVLNESSCDSDIYRLTGLVTLPDGSPANGATVYLSHGTREYREIATTNTDGSYVFDDLEAGKYSIWAERNELTSLEERDQGKKFELAQARDAEKSVDLSLHEGCRYAITVLDKSTRQPIADAKLTNSVMHLNRSYSTNQSGFVEIAGLPSNEWSFALKAATYARCVRSLPKQPLGSRTDVVIELEPGSTLTGTIRDKEGKGVNGVKVFIAEILPGGISTVGLGGTETDQEGKFELNSVPWGTEFQLTAVSENYVRLNQRLTIPLDVKRLNVDLSLTRAVYGGDCIVYVVNETGAPIAGASVENKGVLNLDFRKGETDELGMIRLDNLFNGSRGKNAIVKAAGFISQEVRLVAGKKEKPGEVTVKLVKGQSIRGQLLKPNSEPAPFVGVRYSHEDPSIGRDLGDKTYTDANGQFHFDALPSRSLFSFDSVKPFAPIVNRALPVGGGDEVIVKLAYEGVIRIRALDEETKKAIPEFNVKVAFSSDKRPNDPTIGGLQMNLTNPGINIGGNLKEFRLGQLTAGWPAQITVSAKGYFKKVLRRVEATLESESEVINVELTPEDDSMFRTVSGVIIDSSGQPVADASVRLLVFKETGKMQVMPFRFWNRIDSPQPKEDPDCLQYLRTKTNQDGTFKLERVQIGDTVELLHFGGHAANGRKILCDSKSLPSLEGLVIEAPLAGSIKVIVNLEKYPNAYSVTVSSFDLYSAVGQATKQLDGKVSSVVFDQLPPGLYRVSLQEKNRQSKKGLYPSLSDTYEKVDLLEKDEEIVEFK
jgi:hypothetical protein